MKSIICMLLILFSLKILALNLENHFYAYGQNNTIDVFWNYVGVDDVIGCNLLRSEEPYGQFTQINDELIIPVENEFHFIDAEAVADTIDYNYKVEYVFTDSTFFYNRTFGSFKEISLNVLDEHSIEFFIDTRNTIMYDFYWYVDYAVYYYIAYCDSITMILDLDQLQYVGEDYRFEFTNLINGSHVMCHFTLDYLYDLVNSSNYYEVEVPSSKILLNQNYPNPFNPITHISFDIPFDNQVSLTIYNSKGQKVKTLIDDFIHTGHHVLEWNGTDNMERQVSSGLYYYKLESDNNMLVRKLLLLK